MSGIAERLAVIRERMRRAAERAGRDPETVRLIAVSKTVPVEGVREAMAAGQRLFGENYLQEAKEKVEALGREAVWHFIGPIQSNKAKTCADLFDVVETVSRFKVAELLEKRLAEQSRRLDVFMQVNIGREAQKSGVLPEEAGGLLKTIGGLPHLRVRGLMAMPPWSEDPEQTRPFFRRMRRLADELREQGLLGGHGPVELSMGMSGDFEVAIEEGATLVRVGTALFGERRRGGGEK